MNRLTRAVSAAVVVVAAAATLAGASGAAPTASPAEANIIDPLSLRGEAIADRSESQMHGKSKKHNSVATPS